MASIYVGTYAKYNNGSLKGDWLALDDYSGYDEFMEACLELHSDEDDPELMFQDWEFIPDCFISECSIDPEFWEFMEHEADDDAKEAYVELFGRWDEQDFEDKYRGHWESDEEMAEEYVEETGMLSEVPESIQRYFDMEAFARDLAMDFSEHNGHYFWNH